jgi:preprotein translocase subunit YajC
MHNILFLLNQQQQSPKELIVPFVAMILFIWFFIMRPQRKKQKELNNVQYGIKVGDWVLNAAGMYGKIVDIIEEIVVVEYGTNKGVRVPIQRSSIVTIEEPNMTISREVSDEGKEEK